MPLHPQAQRFLSMVAGAPPLDTMTAEASRAALRAAIPLTGTPAALADVTDTTLPGPGGPVPVRVYRPSPAAGLPAVAYFHGGGWLMGDLDSHDTTCRDIARYAEAVVVAVHYRRPPEHPFPAAYEDCLAVTRALLDGSAGLGTDPTRVAIAGDSAGGNMAASIAQALRGSAPGLVHQVLIYPLTDARMSRTSSYEKFAEGHFLTRRDIEHCMNTYAGGADREDPRLSPGLTKDLSGLPAATVITAECDPLCDEGEAYAAALRAASVQVEYRCFEGQVHPFVLMGGIIDAAHEARRLIGERLRQSFVESPRVPAVSLEACLPAQLRGPGTTFTPLGSGLSGAAVYRVEAAGQAFVLKVAHPDKVTAEWRRKVELHRLVAEAGLAPPVIHVDEARRAVLSAFVADRSFPALYANPATHEAALTLLGRTLRRLHGLPLPSEAKVLDAREFLTERWSGLQGSFPVPAFVSEAVRRVLTAGAPPGERGLVLSHNDINPGNLVYDGQQLLLVDWDNAGPNDPLYDLAAIAVFLRMEEGACLKLLSAYDGARVSSLPAGFDSNRELVAVQCGVTLLSIARRSGHAGASGEETFDSALSLGAFYQRMMAGALSLATAEGQWCFGLALVKESFAWNPKGSALRKG